MRNTEPIELTRDIEAILIPNGTPIRLPKGTEVRITQSLGDTYTVTTDDGHLARISGKDADALGLEAAKPAADVASAGAPEDVEKAVWEQLRTCYDPEIPVNIVDLGLVYHCEVKPLDDGGHRAEIKMTLTAPGCGMGGVIAADAQSKIESVPGIKSCEVEVVFDPPWNPGMMSEAARLELGMM